MTVITWLHPLTPKEAGPIIQNFKPQLKKNQKDELCKDSPISS